MPVMEDIGMYLGVITVWGRSKYDALTYIKDRVLAKIMGWKQQFISQVGKEVLIKAIDMVVPTYPMNRDGGLNFCNLKDFNSTILAKQCWRLLHESDSL
ncbi:hypothetical protein FF1_035195 [Malus domestica]